MTSTITSPEWWCCATMSNEKAGCGRIPLVSESRLKIAALSSDPGNSFRGFWHCAEILTFSLLPSRASRWRREHVPRQQASTAVSPTSWAHTRNCTPEVFQNQPIFLSVMTSAFGWLTLTIEVHSSHQYISNSVSGLLKTVPNHRQVWKRWMSNWFAFQTSPKLDSFHCVTAPLKGNCAPCLLILGLFSNSSKSRW